jgi:hypothetical protein
MVRRTFAQGEEQRPEMDRAAGIRRHVRAGRQLVQRRRDAAALCMTQDDQERAFPACQRVLHRADLGAPGDVGRHTNHEQVARTFVEHDFGRHPAVGTSEHDRVRIRNPKCGHRGLRIRRGRHRRAEAAVAIDDSTQRGRRRRDFKRSHFVVRRRRVQIRQGILPRHDLGPTSTIGRSASNMIDHPARIEDAPARLCRPVGFPR